MTIIIEEVPNFFFSSALDLFSPHKTFYFLQTSSISIGV